MKGEKMNDNALPSIEKITAAQVVQVYQGRPGCACGCQGTYSDDPKVIEAVLTILKRRASEVFCMDLTDNLAYSLESRRRVLTAYVTPAVLKG
jgi:hypothetical protein